MERSSCTMASSSGKFPPYECYQNWMIEQQQLLEELVQVYNQKPNEEQELCCVIDKLVKHFQRYSDRRSQLAIHDAPSFFSPTWLTSIENSCFWLGGCRPSVMTRLVHSLGGSQLEAQLTELSQQEMRTGNIRELSESQLSLVSELKCRTIREEERLSEKMDSLQENIDCPLTRHANNSGDSDTETQNGQVVQALDSHSKDLASILADSDKLRMDTLKELLGIFTPLQAVEFLIAGKKLHLCMHQWGQERDHHQHGETQLMRQ